MAQIPEISILIPAYNAEKTIIPAIWSVLNQSFPHFELLIYNDGSTDQTATLIENFRDTRIRFFNQKENTGIVAARNFLIKNAKGKYIVWLDADDIMLPDRLSLQLNFLDSNPDVFMVGSAVEVRNDYKIKAVSWPNDSNIVHAWLFFRNPLVQSSLMMRNMQGNIAYQTEFEYLEDYDFYSRIFTQNKIAILPEFLCSYYQDKGEELIHKYRKYNFVNKLESIMQRNFSLLEIKVGKYDISLIRDFLRSNHRLKKDDVDIVFNFLNSVLINNNKLQVFDENSMKKVVYFLFLRLLKTGGFKNSKNVFIKLITHPVMVVQCLQAKPKYWNK